MSLRGCCKSGETCDSHQFLYFWGWFIIYQHLEFHNKANDVNVMAVHISTHKSDPWL